MFKTSLLLALVAVTFSSGAALAQDADAQVKSVCDHLKAHASDYDAEDAGACLTELGAILKQMPDATRASFVTCVTTKTPIVKEDFGKCFEAALGAGGGAAMPAPGLPPTGPLDPALETQVDAVCAHLKANAADMPADAHAECKPGLSILAQLGGAEPFGKFSTCILAKPAPVEADLEACIKGSGIEAALGGAAGPAVDKGAVEAPATPKAPEPK